MRLLRFCPSAWMLCGFEWWRTVSHSILPTPSGCECLECPNMRIFQLWTWIGLHFLTEEQSKIWGSSWTHSSFSIIKQTMWLGRLLRSFTWVPFVSFPRSGNSSGSQIYPFTSWLDYYSVFYTGAALEDHLEPSAGPECSNTASERHALICPCNTSALQAMWLLVCFLVQFKVLVANVKSYTA